jgi:hypothetical protein
MARVADGLGTLFSIAGLSVLLEAVPVRWGRRATPELAFVFAAPSVLIGTDSNAKI